MKILGIETSCDETAAAVVEDGKTVLSSCVISQIDLHRPYAGVVPEIASRAHVSNIVPLIRRSLKEADCKAENISGIAVTRGPGLAGALLVGLSAAKALAFVLEKPLIGVDHLMAHIYASFLTESPPSFPFIALLVSGGHTLLLRLRSWTDCTVMGTTIDDAVGEAYDKVARMLGLSYPGGPVIDEWAQKGNERAIEFPKITMYNKKKGNYNFSYSGLKTAVMYYLKKGEKFSLEDICASFQRSALSVLQEKTLRLCEQEHISTLVLAGGVAANKNLRAGFQKIPGLDLHIPPLKLCTDNAAMVAGMGSIGPMEKIFDNPDLKIYSKQNLKMHEGVFV